MRNKKNIWIINQYAGSPTYGMNYRSYYLGSEFVKKGHSVRIFSGSFSHLFVKLPLNNSETIDGIKYVWIKTPTYKGSKSISRIYNMIIFFLKLFFIKTKTFEKPDTIIVSSLSIFPIVNGYFWAKKYKAQLIFEIRDLWPLTFIELGKMSPSHPVAKIIGWFEKFGYKNADEVVCLFPLAHKYMTTVGLKIEKFHYLPNGISLNEVNQRKFLSNSEKKKIPDSNFLVVYTGTLGIANALEFFLQSAALLKEYKDIHFLIVGSGSSEKDLKDLKEKLSLDNVTFLGHIEKLKIQSILEKSDICYIGGHNSSMYQYGVSPNKIFDYMYAAKPILFSVNDGYNLLERAQCGITVKPENPQAIADGILRLYKMSDSERFDMGSSGKDFVIREHSYENIAKKYIDIIIRQEEIY